MKLLLFLFAINSFSISQTIISPGSHFQNPVQKIYTKTVTDEDSRIFFDNFENGLGQWHLCDTSLIRLEQNDDSVSNLAFYFFRLSSNVLNTIAYICICFIIAPNYFLYKMFNSFLFLIRNQISMTILR